jgi:hypothetical protein
MDTEPSNHKVFVIDIDGTICSQDGANYQNAEPFPSVIRKVNKLYDAGHKIIFFTARGSTTGTDWRKLTLEQLKLWGVRYHQLELGKPFGHYYVDDKSMSPREFLETLQVQDYGTDGRPTTAK